MNPKLLLNNCDFVFGAYSVKYDTFKEGIPVYLPSWWNYEFTGAAQNAINHVSRLSGGLVVSLDDADGVTSFSQTFNLSKDQNIHIQIVYEYIIGHIIDALEYSFKIFYDSALLNGGLSDNGLEDFHPQHINEKCKRSYSFNAKAGAHTIKLSVETNPGNTGLFIIHEAKVEL